MVSPNVGLRKGDKLLYPDHHLIWCMESGFRPAQAAYIYFVLYEQITSLRPSQTGCAVEFRCGTTLFKRLITGKRQPSGPGRSREARGGSSRQLEEVAEMEGATPAKQRRKATKMPAAVKPTPRGRGRRG